MKATTIKAVCAMQEFFTYFVTPEELSKTLQRAATLEDSAKDREILCSLAHQLDNALS